jgi:exodeoxyribonuclease VIII
MSQAELETNEQYHADTTRLSNSMLNILKRSPKLFWSYYIAKCLAFPETSDSMALGSMVHTLLLEPEEFKNRYRFKPECDRRTKEGKAIYNDFVASLPERCEIVTSDDFAKAMQCAASLNSHEEYSNVMKATWDTRIVEQRIDFEIDGVEMRSKLDYLSLPAQVCIDIKTSRDASPVEFSKSIMSYGYHRQAAIYREAVLQKHGIECRFVFAVVCTEPPYECALYEPSEMMLQDGMIEVSALLREFKVRSESDDWASQWSKGIVPIELPRWYKPTFYEVYS